MKASQNIKTMNDILGINVETLERIKKSREKTVLLFGFGKLQRVMLLRLAEQGIHVDGFLVPSEEQEDLRNGVRFLGKEIISLTSVQKYPEAYLVVDVLGDHLKFLGESGIFATHLVDIHFDSVVIYGAGEQGGVCYQNITPYGIRVVKYCDRDVRKQGKKYNGAEVISPEALRRDCGKYPVIVALDASKVEEACLELVEKEITNRIFLWDASKFDFLFMVRLFPERGDVYVCAYLLQRLINQRRKVVLYGARWSLAPVAKALGALDLDVPFCVDCGGFEGEDGEMKYCSPYDIIYEDSDSIAVIVFPDGVDAARKFVRESGIDHSNFYQQENSSIFFEFLVDPFLGHNIRCEDVGSLVVLRSCSRVGSSVKRIGVLGGSTSDVSAYNENSWLEELAAIASDAGLNWEIIAGGVSSYTVAHETIKFIRDMSRLRLDIVISYSRINEPGIIERGGRRMPTVYSSYQVYLFRQLAKMKSKSFGKIMNLSQSCGDEIVYFGEEIDDVAEHWLHYERLMHAMCNELGMKFLAVCQPSLFEKKPLIAQERELMYCDDMDSLRRGELVAYRRKIREKVKEQNLPWLLDFTEIIDGHDEDIYMDVCHFTSFGNRIVAENIFEHIAKELDDRSVIK